MRFLQSSWCPICIGLFACIVILANLFIPATSTAHIRSAFHIYHENELWHAPDPSEIPPDAEGDLIRYGRELVVNTRKYLGPGGIVSASTNGMNCQNCHLDGGTRNFSNPFSAAASTYPRYRHRSGRVESLEFRVNDCLQRSLNGQPLDSISYEMRAFVAYLEWVGSGVPEDVVPKGFGTGEIRYLDRAADPVKGKQVFVTHCIRCHGKYGEGSPAGAAIYYPPLWGDSSFNTAAGLYRIRHMAGFIRTSMPFDKPAGSVVLTDGEAWDVAAYIVSQPRPHKVFEEDWSDISKKPFDFPFGPYADPFTERQHKYGPFPPIMEFYEQKKAARRLP